MSGVTLSGEVEALHAQTRLTMTQLRELNRAAASASFLPREAREAAIAAIDREWTA